MTTTATTTATETPAARVLLILVYFISFFCGMTQCFESVFLPEMKEFFHLGYQQQMYIMFAKNIAFLLALFVGLHVVRVGYKNCLTIAMMLYATGTLLLVPALRVGRYPLVLLAFFVIGTGFTVHMVAGSPLLSALGPAKGASSRLNFGNSLGAIAQIIAPVTVTFIIPATVISVSGKLPYIEGIFITFGVGLVAIAGITLFIKDVDIAGSLRESSTLSDVSSLGSVWQYPKVVFGFASIFLLLGTEAALFGLFRNYLEDPTIAGVTAHQSERLFTIYFTVFALGRLLAAGIQKKIKPATHMVVHLLAAILCVALAMFVKGTPAIVNLIALGFCVSIFFPTLYAMAIENMGDLTGPASGLLTLGFLGSALIPVLQGRLADSIGLQRSYGLGLFGYFFALFYVLKNWPVKAAGEIETSRP